MSPQNRVWADGTDQRWAEAALTGARGWEVMEPQNVDATYLGWGGLDSTLARTSPWLEGLCLSCKKSRGLKPRLNTDRSQRPVSTQFPSEGPFLIICSHTLGPAAPHAELVPCCRSGRSQPSGDPGESGSWSPRPTCPRLTLPSCACGMSVARGSARSSSWPGPGQAERRPASPRSGLAARTGHAPWSSSKSIPRRSRCCWLWAGDTQAVGPLGQRPRAGPSRTSTLGQRVCATSDSSLPWAGLTHTLTSDLSRLLQPRVTDPGATQLGTQSSDLNPSSSSLPSKLSLESVGILSSGLKKALIPRKKSETQPVGRGLQTVS